MKPIEEKAKNALESYYWATYHQSSETDGDSFKGGYVHGTAEQVQIDDAERDTAVYNLLMLKLDAEKKLWLDKACEWIKNNLGYYDRHEVHIGKSYEEVVIDDFRKAMAEG